MNIFYQINTCLQQDITERLGWNKLLLGVLKLGIKLKHDSLPFTAYLLQNITCIVLLVLIHLNYHQAYIFEELNVIML